MTAVSSRCDGAFLQLGPSALPPLQGSGASQQLAQDSRKAVAERALKEQLLLDPNTKALQPPKRKQRAKTGGKSSKKKKGGGGGGGGGGFGKGAAPALTAAQQAHALRLDTVNEDGVCPVLNVLGSESVASL